MQCKFPLEPVLSQYENTWEETDVLLYELMDSEIREKFPVKAVLYSRAFLAQCYLVILEGSGTT